MTVWDTLGLLLLAAFLGVVGQSARTVLGVTKILRAPGKKSSITRIKEQLLYLTFGLLLAFAVGMVAGVFAVYGFDLENIGKEEAWTIIFAGYAGTDFIEGVGKTISRGK